MTNRRELLLDWALAIATFAATLGLYAAWGDDGLDAAGGPFPRPRLAAARRPPAGAARGLRRDRGRQQRRRRARRPVGPAARSDHCALLLRPLERRDRAHARR